MPGEARRGGASTLSDTEVKETLGHMLGLMAHRAEVDDGIQTDRQTIRLGVKLQAGEARSYMVGSTLVELVEKNGDYLFRIAAPR